MTPTAFDNADICEIDKKFSLGVKVQAPTIFRKTLKTENTASTSSGIALQQSLSRGSYVPATKANYSFAKGQQKSKNNEEIFSAQTTVNTPSMDATIGNQLSNDNLQRHFTNTDTYSSLSKKRSGILQR